MKNLQIKCSLDTVKYESKPCSNDIMKINQRMAQNSNDYSKYSLPYNKLPELIGEKGHTFCGAIFNGAKQVVNFKAQQMFGLDFDNGITFDEVVKRCEKYDLPISFAYETFSSVNCSKFRVVMLHSFNIIDTQVASLIQLALMTIFPECDKACKDVSRLFFGGNKKCIYVNEDIDNACFTVDKLMFSLYSYLRYSDEVNLARNIKNFASNTGIELINNMPFISIVGDNEVIESNEDPSKTTYVYECDDLNYIITMSNNVSKGCKNLNNPKYDYSNTKMNFDNIQKFNFKTLSEKCKLFNEFENGSEWLYHQELFGLAQNLCCIKGGKELFLNILYSDKNSEYPSYRDKNWNYYTDYVRKNYNPCRCDGFCKYKDTCSHGKNLIGQVYQSNNTIEVVSKVETITLEETEKRLVEAFNTIRNGEKGKVYCLKSSVGVGKTHQMIELGKNKNIMYALPTHKLKDEVYNRAIENGLDIKSTPMIPILEDLELSSKVNKFYNNGNFKLARNEMYKYVQNHNNDDAKKINEYFANEEDALNFKGSLATTHKKAVHLENVYQDIVIYDEDITNSVIEIKSISIKNLIDLQDRISFSNNDESIQFANELIQIINNSDVYTTCTLDVDSKKLKSFIKLNNSTLNFSVDSPILGFLNADFFIKVPIVSEDETTYAIYFVEKFELNKSVINVILSATLDYNICNKLFQDRLVWIDIGETENAGNLYQDISYSCSRSSLSNKSTESKIKEFIKSKEIDNVITFKASESEYNASLHFGNVEGFDFMSGKDLVVVGTPHYSNIKYLLLASALGYKVNSNNTEFKPQNVEYNGFKFKFNTFSDVTLRQIQLWTIESELVQSIGRARLTRNDCNVYLLSNFPLKQASFIKEVSKIEVVEKVEDIIKEIPEQEVFEYVYADIEDIIKEIDIMEHQVIEMLINDGVYFDIFEVDCNENFFRAS